MEYVWSDYSKAIYSTWQETESNIIVQAAPGAGKTTNIAHMWGLDQKSTVYVVFNKQNQVEAQAKLPQKAGSAVLTTHSLGLRAISATYGRPAIDEKKVIGLIRRYVSPRLKREVASKNTRVTELEWTLKRAVDTAKFTCMSTACEDKTYHNMLNIYDLDEYEGMQGDIETILDYNDEMVDMVDFGDMIRLPALYRCTMPSFEHVLCDEVQDFNSMQALLIAKLQAEKYCFVGDAHQSIYGFRGAMLDSMAYLKTQFDCVELPLSISYRCPVAVVREAAAIWPSIEAWEHAEQGEVRHIDSEDSLVADELRGVRDARQALVLCRTNAPLIAYAYQLLGQGIACHVRGRDIGQGLVRLVKQFPVSTVGELLACVQEWQALEVAKAQATEDAEKVVRVRDKVDSLIALTWQVKLDDHPDSVVQGIEALFAEGRGVALSTVHKAKGLEAERCYLLRAELFRNARVRSATDWQQEQEKNVEYVAVTRAQRVLTYCLG